MTVLVHVQGFQNDPEHAVDMVREYEDAWAATLQIVDFISLGYRVSIEPKVMAS